VRAVYDHPAKAAAAVAALRQRGLGPVTAYAAYPDESLEAALAPGASPVRAYALAGGLIGGASGLALTVLTALDLPLVTGGKPIVSLPPFLVIVFELTILLACLGSFLGFLVSSRLPALRADEDYDPRFARDGFGVAVACPPEEKQEARALLEQAGALEVRDATAAPE
jgi:molybdopterin-containing oxidoreductase family membrane subunit